MARREASFFCLCQFSHIPFPTLRILLPDSNRSPQTFSLAKRLCPCDTRWFQGCGVCKRWKQSPTNLVSRYRTLFLRFRRARYAQRRGAPTARLPPCTSEVSSRKRRCLGTSNAAAAAGKGRLSHSRAEESRRASSCVPCLLQHPGTPARIPVGTSGLLTRPSTGTAGRFP